VEAKYRYFVVRTDERGLKSYLHDDVCNGPEVLQLEAQRVQAAWAL